VFRRVKYAKVSFLELPQDAVEIFDEKRATEGTDNFPLIVFSYTCTKWDDRHLVSELLVRE
jgi:hypothetical protein